MVVDRGVEARLAALGVVVEVVAVVLMFSVFLKPLVSAQQKQ